MKVKTKQPKTKNRITALLLAFLLTATILSPTITASAVDTTEIDSDRDSGGHQTGTGGDGETSGGRPTGNDASFESYMHYKTRAGTGRMIEKEDTFLVTLEGEGHFNVRTIDLNVTSAKRHSYFVYVFSDKPFTCVVNQTSYQDGELKFSGVNLPELKISTSTQFGNSSYYYFSLVLGHVSEDGELISLNSLHKLSYTVDTSITTDTEKAIESTLDLTISDYKSDEDKTNMTPVRDESIGYLPRVRYFDNRNDSELSFDYYNDYDATIQWASFEEPYASDLDNPYYVEVYAQIHYKLGNASNASNVKMVQYKKYGELKYISERLEFPHREPADNYLLSIGAHLWSKVEGLNPDSDMAIQERSIKYFYVRLVHYDYDKQQLLCGGWTRLKVNDDGGCTSEEGDFPPDNEDDWTPDNPDKDPDEWGDTGDEKDPNKPDPDNPDPDNPDLGIDTSSIGAFIVSVITSLLNAIKSILLLVGEFPDLCKHVFSFLPDEISTMMFLGTTAIVVMRFLGR